MGAPPEGILCMYGLHIKSSTGDVDKHRKQIRNFSLCDVIAAVRRRKFARYCKTVKVRNSHNVACMLLLRSEKRNWSVLQTVETWISRKNVCTPAVNSNITGKNKFLFFRSFQTRSKVFYAFGIQTK